MICFKNINFLFADILIYLKLNLALKNKIKLITQDYINIGGIKISWMVLKLLLRITTELKPQNNKINLEYHVKKKLLRQFLNVARNICCISIYIIKQKYDYQ